MKYLRSSQAGSRGSESRLPLSTQGPHWQVRLTLAAAGAERAGRLRPGVGGRQAFALRRRRAQPISPTAPAPNRAKVPGSGAAAAEPPAPLPPPPCDVGSAAERRRAPRCVFISADRRRNRRRCTQRNGAELTGGEAASNSPIPAPLPNTSRPPRGDRRQSAAGQRAGRGDVERAAADRRPAGVRVRAAEGQFAAAGKRQGVVADDVPGEVVVEPEDVATVSVGLPE